MVSGTGLEKPKILVNFYLEVVILVARLGQAK